MGMNLKHVAAFSGLLLGSCSAATLFPYQHYGMDAEAYTGTLLGPEEKDDLPLERCKPLEMKDPKTGEVTLEYQCMVLFKDDFFKLKEDYKKLKVDLQGCQEKRKR